MVLAVSIIGCGKSVVTSVTEDTVSDTVVTVSDVTATTAEDVTQSVGQ